MLIVVINIASIPKTDTGPNASNTQPAPEPPVVSALHIILISLFNLILVLILLFVNGLGWGVMGSVIAQ